MRHCVALPWDAENWVPPAVGGVRVAGGRGLCGGRVAAGGAEDAQLCWRAARRRRLRLDRSRPLQRLALEPLAG